MPEQPQRDHWGHKLHFSVYFKGEPDEATWERVIDAVNAATPNAVFAGCSIVDVPDEPKDQVAT